MSSWHKHQATATGVYDECCIGDCAPGDLCFYEWDRDRRGCPHNRTFNRFVTVGSIKYGVRVGAVSPPPPGVRYRVIPSSGSSGNSVCGNSNGNNNYHKQHLHSNSNHYRQHNRYESTPSASQATQVTTEKDCCCNIVNLPWPRSVSRIPLLATTDKQQPSINSASIFSSVNSSATSGAACTSAADISSNGGYVGCSLLPLAECRREQRKRGDRNNDNTRQNKYDSECVSGADHEHKYKKSTATTTTDNNDSRTGVNVSSGKVALTSPRSSCSSQSHLLYQQHKQHRLDASAGYSFAEALEASLLSSPSPSPSPSALRRRVLVRSQSVVADAAAAPESIWTATSAHEHNQFNVDSVIVRRNTLDRLHRFRFGGNRANIRGKKTASTNTGINTSTAAAAGATTTSTSTSNTTTSAGKDHHKTERLRELTDRLKTSVNQRGGAQLHVNNIKDMVSPVPPPRNRHHCAARVESTLVPSSSLPSPVTAAASPPPPPTPPPTPPPPPPPPTPPPSPPTISAASTTTANQSKSYQQHRAHPFRSASFSLVDFSPDGKYFRKRILPPGSSESSTNAANTNNNNNNHQQSTASIRTAFTLPRDKKEYQKILSNNTFVSAAAHKHLTRTRPIDITVNERGDIERTSDCVDDSVTISSTLSATQTQTITTTSPTVTQQQHQHQHSNNEEKKRDRSRRRKGMYISQWPDQRASVILAYAEPQNTTNTTVPGSESNENGTSTGTTIHTPSRNHNTIDELASVTVTDSTESSGSAEEKQSTTNINHQFNRVDSLSEGENDQNEPAHVEYEQRKSLIPVTNVQTLSDPPGGDAERCPNIPRRYSKRPLRGPYAQMLEAEMKRPTNTEKTTFVVKNQYNTNEFKYLDDGFHSSNTNITDSMVSLTSGNSLQLLETPTPTSKSSKLSSNRSFDDTNIENRTSAASLLQRKTPGAAAAGDVSSSSSFLSNFECDDLDSEPMQHSQSNPNQQRRLFTCHQRTTSSPSKFEEIALPTQNDRAASVGPSTEFLCHFIARSSEQLLVPGSAASGSLPDDTRTHIVVELYENERSYVESLQILVMKYLEPLKSAENSFLLDAALVDEIFYQVPSLLFYHQEFLEELRKRLENWDVKQKIGDIFSELTKPAVIEAYTCFINNWKRAKEVIKTASQAKPAFARFLEAMAREHKGKLALDSLLIKPVQKFPKYELLIQRLIKHTDPSHPDYSLLLEAQKEVHENLIKINCTEREMVEFEQQQQNLKELEGLVEGLVNLVTADRVYLRHDLVTMTSGQGTRKERALFLFSDLLIITSIKRRSGTIKKPTGNCPGSVTSTLDANKYKLLMRIPLEDLEIMKTKDENMRRVMLEIENLTDDISVLNQIHELIWSLHCPHAQLEDTVREMLSALNRQLTEQQNNDTQLSYLDLTLNTSNGVEHLSIVFSKPEKRASWEEAFHDAKQKLAISVDRRPSPEFLAPVPIRKTRAGLQFTCAAPTLTADLGAIGTTGVATPPPTLDIGSITRDVWVCNSDGYVGQVCVLSLHPEPTVTSCNGVCNARILCIAAVPAATWLATDTTPTPAQTQHSRKIANDEADIGGEENRTNNIHLDSNSSSSSTDEEDSEREECNEKGESKGTSAPITTTSSNEILLGNSSIKAAAAASLNRGKSMETASTDSSEDSDSQQPTMWLGTEDGCIHIYNCNDNIRIKKNKIRLQHGSSILCIIYLDNRVFVSLANGDITIYSRDQSGTGSGGWNISSPMTVSLSTALQPVNRMLLNGGQLWCSCANTIKILNIHSLTVEHTFQTNNDRDRGGGGGGGGDHPNTKTITCMVQSGLGVWLALHHSAVIKCFHTLTYEFLCEVNMAPAVTKMLTSCDDIIRQHKAACLRVTSLLACKDLLWIGTSAGVLLTMPLPHITASTTKISVIPNITGVPHGHTGHVRFLTCMEISSSTTTTTTTTTTDCNSHNMIEVATAPGPDAGEKEADEAPTITTTMAATTTTISQSSTTTTTTTTNSHKNYGFDSVVVTNHSKLLVISGGDGYEDFRNSNMSDIAGREDSTNHLLLWHV